MTDLSASQSVLPMTRILEEHTPETPLGLLTQRMAAGEEAAFAEWHGLYAARLFRYTLVLERGDEHTARDVLQETLVRIARHVRRFDEDDIFWSWLTKLARSVAADHGRKRSRYRRFVDLFRAQPPEPEPPAPDQLAEALEAALTQLPPEEADLLRAKYHDHATQRDLAARLGITEEALESRMRRARAALRTRAFQFLQDPQP